MNGIAAGATIAHRVAGPTVSSPEVMRLHASVRNRERDELIAMVELRPGMTILDIQSAGGYLSDEIYRRLGGDAAMICLEPCDDLRARLDPAYRAIKGALDSFDGIDDNSVDAALGLIALHHSPSHQSTVREAWRVLRQAGQLAMCDVEEGSRLAAFLNDFVDQHCPTGHEGHFLRAGAMERMCLEAGFVDVEESRRDVPWIFEKRSDIAPFFQGLFGLAVDVPTIDRALDRYFTIRERPGRCVVEWQLLYCSARKPAPGAKD